MKVKVSEDGSEITITGKLGSTTKQVNTSLMSAKLGADKLTLEDIANKKVAKKADACRAGARFRDKERMQGRLDGRREEDEDSLRALSRLRRDKGKEMLVKNMFGERNARIAKIVGDTKVEVKGQDVTIKGVDPYDVGQTAANIKRLSFVRKKDTRVFQDGIYHCQGGMILMATKKTTRQVPGAEFRREEPKARAEEMEKAAAA